MKILELGFGFSFWIEGAEMDMEFEDEVGVVREPGDINSGGQGGFKPIQCSPLEIGQRVGILSAVISECIRLVSKIKEPLGQKGL